MNYLFNYLLNYINIFIHINLNIYVYLYVIAKEESSAQSFPRGQHPLEGVPNLSELPSPEELKGVSK